MPVLPMAPLYEERDTRVALQRSNDYQRNEQQTHCKRSGADRTCTASLLAAGTDFLPPSVSNRFLAAPYEKSSSLGGRGRVRLGAGEDVVVANQSADDQHLAVGEQGRRQVRTSDVQARW